MWNTFISKITDKKNRLGVILIVGLIHGLIYVFMIPIWHHHEEPGHFEYAWLVAHRQEWPQRGDYDNGIRRQIVESMLASKHENIFNVSEKNLDMDPIPTNLSPVGRLRIPIFPIIISLPLRLVSNANVVTQLYIARLTSLLLFLLSLWLTWLAVGELVKETHPIRWMVPLFLALLPGYLDTMTSVHDDVLGVVSAALFIWLSLRWMKKGLSPLIFVIWVGSLFLCYYGRETTKPLILLAPLVPLISMLRRKAVPVLVPLILILGGYVGSQLFIYREAAQWFHIPAQAASNRVISELAPFGDQVFSLSAVTSKRTFGQSFSPDVIKTLREKRLTLGVWIWADQPTEISMPIIQYRTPNGLETSPDKRVEVGTEPNFYTTAFDIPYSAGHTWLLPLSSFPAKAETIYFDGFVLAEGSFSSNLPEFRDDRLDSGIWDGKPFVNLIRNPSAEKAWFGLNTKVNRFPQPYIDFALYLQSSQDIQGFGWYYKYVGSFLFQGFWGRGAGTQIPLLGSYSYKFLQIIFALSLLGILRYVFENRSLLQKGEVIFLISILVFGWLPTFFRGITEVFSPIVIVPYSRYAFPAIIPTALLFCGGFWAFLNWINVRYFSHKNFPSVAFLSLMFGVASYAIFSFGGYFYSEVFNGGLLLFFILLILFLVNFFIFVKTERV